MKVIMYNNLKTLLAYKCIKNLSVKQEHDSNWVLYKPTFNITGKYEIYLRDKGWDTFVKNS